jgi:hypothetical protein
MALGSHSPLMLKPLGLRIPVYPVKGYSITLPIVDARFAPESTIMDETHKVAVTRLGERIRVGGTAELAGYSLALREPRRATLEHVVAVSHRGNHFLGTLGWALATAGRRGEARTILEELRARPPAPAVVSEAWLLGALGEVDAAFEVVARAEDECVAYLYFTGLPGFDPLRADPRFAALLQRLDLAPLGAS